MYRGYDVLQDHLPEKKKKAIARKQQLKDEASGGPRTKESIANLKAEAAAAEHGVSDSDSEHATDSLPSSPAKASATKSKSGLSSLFSLAYSSKSKISATNDADEVEAGDDNTTAEAMEDTKSPDDGQAEQELAELVLIVHGIGQKVRWAKSARYCFTPDVSLHSSLQRTIPLILCTQSIRCARSATSNLAILSLHRSSATNAYNSCEHS